MAATRNTQEVVASTGGPHFTKPLNQAGPAKRKVQLERVQETLLMPLWARASQSRAWFGLINDPKAVEVAQAIDYDFSKFDGSLQTQIGCVLRTMQLDAWVDDFLARNPRGTVVDVGAGLNSRFERTDNGHARFFELDLPGAMAARKLFFDETDRRTQITGSVLDDDWIETAERTGGPYLIVIEGVLMYLSEQQVKGLFAKVAGRLPGATLAFDSLSCDGVANQPRMKAMQAFDATFDWGIDVPRTIEAWGAGYVCLDSVNLRHVAVRNRHVIPAFVQMIATALGKSRGATADDYWMSMFRLGPA
jgi:O-methyltransferase involved in polyketide biosynthesis